MPPGSGPDASQSGSGSKGGKGKGAKETLLKILNKKDENFGEWYSEVVKKSDFISYYEGVSGCYILRPDAYEVWSMIQDYFDPQIKKLGIRNAYFPLFVPQDALEREKDHVAGFAPEVAWVTRSGKSELEKPIAIRPTSETVMYPYFAQWIRSHRDLPLRLNQWTNVVRWEFKNPTPFIRSREFLWQEGHTAFATREESEEEVLQILELYRRVYEELLAVPVIKGRKSEAEKFAGALYTTSVEAFIPATGRGIQGATSHCLGQNFSQMFGISFEGEDRAPQLAWQNSWGLSTRSIGVMIMVHSDDKGLVLPPNVAATQVVVIPIPNVKMSDEVKQGMLDKAEELCQTLCDAGIRAVKDFRENYTAGWKYNHWELKGVPVRLELGPRDMEKSAAVLARRDTGKKQFDVPWDGIVEETRKLLETIQSDLLSKAREEFDSCIETATTWDDFMAALDRKHMVLAPWCDEEEVEEQVKKRSATEDAMGAKTLCIPFKENAIVPELEPDAACFATGKPAKNWALWGRSY